MGFKFAAIGGLVAALGMAILYGLWQHERAGREAYARVLDAVTHQRDAAISENNETAAKLKQMEIDIAVMTERRAVLQGEYNKIQGERNNERLHFQQREDALKNAAKKRPEVLARAIRAGINKRMRDLARATCRSNCENTDSKAEN